MATKKIWLYWDQGWEQAPFLVRRCADSWAPRNPDYEIHRLDRRSVADFVSLPEQLESRRGNLSVQKYANILRLALLAAHGGVWADASVYCVRPLADWLGEYYGSGFFAFRNPRPDRLLANWFLAAEPSSVILQRLQREQIAFFTGNSYSNQPTPLGRKLRLFFGRLWNSNYRTTVFWRSWFAREILRVYPYFIFHYLFNRLILTDPECAALWNSARPFPAGPAMSLHWLEGTEGGLERAKAEIESRRTPVFKLNRRADGNNRFWTIVLGLLEQSG